MAANRLAYLREGTGPNLACLRASSQSYGRSVSCDSLYTGMRTLARATRIALTVFLRVVLGGMFLAAGLSKAGQTMPTLAAIYSYQILLPDWLALGIAEALPWAEILLGASVLAGVWPRLVLPATAAVLAAFTALTAQAWWRELPIDCGCFDFASIHPALAVLGTTGGATLRNLVLLVLVGALALLRRQRQSAA